MTGIRPLINRTAHRLAVLAELDFKAELERITQALRAAGATQDTIRAYLARCEAAGRVLEPVEKDGATR